MERGFEQLILLAIFLLAALVDWVVRWMKGKTRAPTTTDETSADDEAEAAAEREWLRARAEEAARAEARMLEEAPARARAQEEARVRARAQQAARRRDREPIQRPAFPQRAGAPMVGEPQAFGRDPDRAPAVEELMVRRPVQPVVRAAKVVRRPGNARVRRLLRNPATVRQAIVAMEVLGPCRGLQHT